MSKTTRCTGIVPKLYRQTPDGWPFGRYECYHCGGFYTLTKAGRLRAHTPHDVANETAYESEHRAAMPTEQDALREIVNRINSMPYPEPPVDPASLTDCDGCQ